MGYYKRLLISSVIRYTFYTNEYLGYAWSTHSKYLVESNSYESVNSGRNGKAEIAHLRQLLLRMQKHLYII